jgi:NitT/TauT family transport system ATP-binding protein
MRSPENIPLLEVSALCIDYGTGRACRHAVENVSFTLDVDERLVLLGPSGCGKSPNLKAVAGFLQPSSGRVRLRGRDITGAGPDRVMVFQEFDQLLPWKTAAAMSNFR